METVDLKIEGMTCGGCAKSVTRVLSGVESMKQAVERAGFKAA